MYRYPTIFTICLFLFLSCQQRYRASDHSFPSPVDTHTRPVSQQEYKLYAFPEAGITVDNRFAGARLNGASWIAPDTLRALISPENEPINPSAYYAFRISADSARTLVLELTYSVGFHRYWPKRSLDGDRWLLVDSTNVWTAPDSSRAVVHIEVGPDPVWIAGQEIRNSGHVRTYCDRHSWHPAVNLSVIDTSKLGRDLLCLDINEGDPRGKDVVALFSRQHPPEVTGYFALEAFVNEILDSNPLSDAFRKKYRVLVYPLINPDGVDLGHWRHNAGGVDLNRDWAYYRQPETRRVADHLVRTTKKAKSEVILGLDFHSTWYDIYYTPDESIRSSLQGFSKEWVQAIDAALPEYTPNEIPEPVKQPVSSDWFYLQFGAEGITFEIGDTTDRAFVRRKGRVAAQEMMRILLRK